MIATHLIFFSFLKGASSGFVPPTPPAAQPFQGAGRWDVDGQPGLEELHAEHRRLYREKQEAQRKLEAEAQRQAELKEHYDRQRKVKKQARAKREADALAYRQAVAYALQETDRLNAAIEGYASDLMRLDMALAQAEGAVAAQIEFERQNMNALALLLLS